MLVGTQTQFTAGPLFSFCVTCVTDTVLCYRKSHGQAWPKGSKSHGQAWPKGSESNGQAWPKGSDSHGQAWPKGSESHGQAWHPRL